MALGAKSKEPTTPLAAQQEMTRMLLNKEESGIEDLRVTKMLILKN